MLARGLTNKEIAAELMVSTATVASHVRGILTKAGLTNGTEAADPSPPGTGSTDIIHLDEGRLHRGACKFIRLEEGKDAL
ncbi:MAG: hypothetical protein Kow0010_10040 [Dehalococcoidia bacterium]